MSDADVLVVGAGPAGCAAAVVLARAGLRVHLAAADRSRHVWAGESLPPGAGAVLARLFGDEVLGEPPHLAAVGVRGAWGSEELVDTDFISHPHGAGWHVDRAVLDRQLRDAASAAGAGVGHGQSVTGVRRTSRGWRVDLGAARVDARWIIDASGRAGAVVGRLGIRRTRVDRQVAEVAEVGNADDAAVTTIEAVPDGWWYSTPLPGRPLPGGPLPGGRRVVAFLTDSDLRSSAPGIAPFADRLAATTHISRLVDPDAPAPRARLFAADTSCRDRLTGRGWSAVGDAAITWDPLSSQGVVTGVLMAARLAASIAHGPDADDALHAWESDYRLLLDDHQGLRGHYASAETRWPDSPFWQRRAMSVRGPGTSPNAQPFRASG